MTSRRNGASSTLTRMALAGRGGWGSIDARSSHPHPARKSARADASHRCSWRKERRPKAAYAASFRGEVEQEAHALPDFRAEGVGRSNALVMKCNWLSW